MGYLVFGISVVDTIYLSYGQHFFIKCWPPLCAVTESNNAKLPVLILFLVNLGNAPKRRQVSR